jgi:polyribonucleotide nucleotidyltransferase
MSDGAVKTHRYVAQLGGEEVVIETGKLAEQAGGAVTVMMGQTMIFATATMSKNIRQGIDFFPLSVDFEEKLYAAGRIPGSYFRREGRPSEQAILISRVIDRPLRPLFPKEMRNEVQVIVTAFSADQEHHLDMLGILAASTAIMISDIPWGGPVAGVRVGMVNGELVVSPSIPEMANSHLDLRVAGTEDAINMVECGADEIDEETMVRALQMAHAAIQPLIQLQKQMQAEVGKQKRDYTGASHNEALASDIAQKTREAVRRVIETTTDRSGRNEALDELVTELLAGYSTPPASPLDEEDEIPYDTNEIREYFQDIVAEEVRRRIVDEGVRPDGRGYTDIRPLSAEVGLIPRVHGSGLFKRGQTQVAGADDYDAWDSA